jgi:hypothetical protein
MSQIRGKHYVHAIELATARVIHPKHIAPTIHETRRDESGIWGHTERTFVILSGSEG